MRAPEPGRARQKLASAFPNRDRRDSLRALPRGGSAASRTSDRAPPDVARPPVVLVGVHGHGRSHLANLERLRRRGRRRAARHPARGRLRPAAADARAARPRRRRPGRRAASDAAAGRGPAAEVTSSAPRSTPTSTSPSPPRARGSHVLLEKPPAPSLAGVRTGWSTGVAAAGRACQVGFQSLGLGGGRRTCASLVADGADRRGDRHRRRLRLGARRGVLGARPLGRAPAAGRRRGGRRRPHQPVRARRRHRAARSTAATGPARWRDDRARAVPRQRHRGRRHLVRAPAHGARHPGRRRRDAVRRARRRDPVVTVHGTRGRIVLAYKRDQVRLQRAGGRADAGRRTAVADLLENLVAHVRDPAVPLLVPLPATTAFMQVVEAVRTAPDPRPIAADAVRELAGRACARAGRARHRRRGGRVRRTARAVLRAGPAVGARARRWPRGERRRPSWRRSQVGGVVVAALRRRRRPRPDARAAAVPAPGAHARPACRSATASPADHRWHLGVGVAIQDVGGVNFWGGRTYVRGAATPGATTTDRIAPRRSGAARRTASSSELAWLAPDGRALLARAPRGGRRAGGRAAGG